MEIIENNNLSIEELEELFKTSFDVLMGKDGDNFSDDTGQEFREWFGIDKIKDYIKYIHVIVAQDEGELVGGAIIGQQNPLTWPDGNKYELFILGVLPKYRGKEIGKKLTIFYRG